MKVLPRASSVQYRGANRPPLMAGKTFSSTQPTARVASRASMTTAKVMGRRRERRFSIVLRQLPGWGRQERQILIFAAGAIAYKAPALAGRKLGRSPSRRRRRSTRAKGDNHNPCAPLLAEMAAGQCKISTRPLRLTAAAELLPRYYTTNTELPFRPRRQLL